MYFFDTFLLIGIIDVNRGNREKTRGLQNVDLQKDTEDRMSGQSDQQASDEQMKKNANEYYQEKKT